MREINNSANKKDLLKSVPAIYSGSTTIPVAGYRLYDQLCDCVNIERRFTLHFFKGKCTVWFRNEIFWANTSQYCSRRVHITRPHHPNLSHLSAQLAASFPSCASGYSRSLCSLSLFLLLVGLRLAGFTRLFFRNTSLKALRGPAWMAQRLFRGRR